VERKVILLKDFSRLNQNYSLCNSFCLPTLSTYLHPITFISQQRDRDRFPYCRSRFGNWPIKCVRLHRFLSRDQEFVPWYAHGISSFGLNCIFLVAAYVTRLSFFRLPTVWCVWYLRNSTNSHYSPHFACSTIERNWYKLYLQTINFQSASSSRSSTVRLFLSCGPFDKAYFKICCACRNNHFLKEIPYRRDNILALHYSSLLLPLW
jgi:hypothetical protein